MSVQHEPRRSLILAGGGMRVAWQAGVLGALTEEGLVFDHVDGTSGGIINLAMLLSGLSPAEMEQRWRTLPVRDFVSMVPLWKYVRLPWLMSFGDADGLVGDVFPHLGIDVASIRSSKGPVGTFNLCNFTHKTIESIPHHRIEMDHLVAGVSLPIFLPPVITPAATYTDAVWIKDANLWEAVRRGAEELWLVWCIGNDPEYRAGFFHQYVHMIEMSANGALFGELERIDDLNQRIESGDSPFGQRRPVRLHVVKPRHPLPLDPDFFWGRITADELIEKGRADARRYLSERTDHGVPLTPEATKMTAQPLGLTFSETMSGPFALGEDQPDRGRDAGRRAGTDLAIHATILIPDLQSFDDHPDHAGEISGTIDYPPLGEGIPATGGRFNLFSPTDHPELKLMIYEVAFEHDGTRYYLAGRKEVHDDPGFDLWKDTTTLLTTLHEGDDATGPVVGAGVLELGVADLARLVKTIRPVGAGNAGDAARAVSSFGRFFLGELWDSYT